MLRCRVRCPEKLPEYVERSINPPDAVAEVSNLGVHMLPKISHFPE